MRNRYLETDCYPESKEVDNLIVSELSRYYKTYPGETEMVNETEKILNKFGYFGEDRPVKVIGKYKREITMNDLSADVLSYRVMFAVKDKRFMDLYRGK